MSALICDVGLILLVIFFVRARAPAITAILFIPACQSVSSVVKKRPPDLNFRDVSSFFVLVILGAVAFSVNLMMRPEVFGVTVVIENTWKIRRSSFVLIAAGIIC